MISQRGVVGYTGGAGYKEGDGVKDGSCKAAKDNPGLNEAVKQTYLHAGTGSARGIWIEIIRRWF
ncbi:MAG TPA: hypothetical protein VLH08_20055 [Acidobacteriota bacterium]|nr:hypothetical protein [Acidobacteriota bacterium]